MSVLYTNLVTSQKLQNNTGATRGALISAKTGTREIIILPPGPCTAPPCGPWRRGSGEVAMAVLRHGGKGDGGGEEAVATAEGMVEGKAEESLTRENVAS